MGGEAGTRRNRLPTPAVLDLIRLPYICAPLMFRGQDGVQGVEFFGAAVDGIDGQDFRHFLHSWSDTVGPDFMLLLAGNPSLSILEIYR